VDLVVDEGRGYVADYGGEENEGYDGVGYVVVCFELGGGGLVELLGGREGGTNVGDESLGAVSIACPVPASDEMQCNVTRSLRPIDTGGTHSIRSIIHTQYNETVEGREDPPHVDAGGIPLLDLRHRGGRGGEIKVSSLAIFGADAQPLLDGQGRALDAECGRGLLHGGFGGCDAIEFHNAGGRARGAGVLGVSI